MASSRVINAIREVFDLSIKDIAAKAGVSENTVRRWIDGGGITPDHQRQLAKELGFESWGQLHRFLVPIDGQVFVLKHFTKDVARVWEHYLTRGTTPIFETKIALSGDRPSVLVFGAKANSEARKRILDGDLTVHRVEQPRNVRRLAELAANAHYFRKHANYSVKLVQPMPDDDLFTYPNLLRFGKKVLLLGRTHKFGSPGANDPLILMRGEAAEVLGDYLEQALWNDVNAKVFSSLEEEDRQALCRKWAELLQPAGGAAAFTKVYADLTSSTATMEKVRI